MIANVSGSTPAASYLVADSNVSNSDNSYTVNVQATDSLGLPDITHTNTDGTPTTLPAQTAMVCTANVAGTVNVNKSDGSLISTQTGATPATDYNVADSGVSSSASAYSVSVRATESLSIPDATITVDSAAFTDVESATTTDIQLVDQSGVTIVPISLVGKVIEINTGTAQAGIAYQRPNYGGQVTQYALYDVKWQLDNGTYDYTAPAYPISFAQLDHAHASPFFNMLYNNYHGSKDRFTSSTGNQTYTLSVVEDHLSGLMWTKTQESSATQSNAMANANASSRDGFSDWRAPTPAEYLTINSWGVATGGMDYPPFNLTLQTVEMWTNETLPNTTGNGATFYANIFQIGLTININRDSKSNSLPYFMVRNFS